MTVQSNRNGILVVDKPQGFTSFDLCAKLRGMLRTKRIGHSGTLDPMATGVMVVLLGTATRAADLLPDQDKKYIAGFRLGETTDTLDITGKTLTKSEFSVPHSRMLSVLEGFRGDIMQLPPMYSAVHSNGQRLYDLARKGIEAERTSRSVRIIELELLCFDEQSGEGELSVKCSKGTYIRSLIDDIGAALGCGAVMTSLCRVEASGFSLEDCITIEQAQSLCDNGTIDERIMPTDSAFKSLSQCRVSPKQTVRYRNGGELSLSRVTVRGNTEQGGLVRVYSDEGTFLGLGRMDAENDALRPYKLF